MVRVSVGDLDTAAECESTAERVAHAAVLGVVAGVEAAASPAAGVALMGGLSVMDELYSIFLRSSRSASSASARSEAKRSARLSPILHKANKSERAEQKGRSQRADAALALCISLDCQLLSLPHRLVSHCRTVVLRSRTPRW